jgi:hypothetical protein
MSCVCSHAKKRMKTYLWIHSYPLTDNHRRDRSSSSYSSHNSYFPPPPRSNDFDNLFHSPICWCLFGCLIHWNTCFIDIKYQLFRILYSFLIFLYKSKPHNFWHWVLQFRPSWLQYEGHEPVKTSLTFASWKGVSNLILQIQRLTFEILHQTSHKTSSAE